MTAIHIVGSRQGAAAMTKPTTAGAKLLRSYVEAERAGDLRPVYDFRGDLLGFGMPLRWGDGSQLLAAQKLSRDGFAHLFGGSNNVNRFLIITDSGREAVS